jgi:glycolate oxidase iron-sulfur subunit
MDNVLEALERCAKCGTCRSVCPIFKESKDETLVTRGKLALYEAALKGNLNASAQLKEILDNCLMCMKCKDKCPSLVETTELIRSAREWLGMPLMLKIGFRFILPHRWLYDWTLRIAEWGMRIYNKLFIRNNQTRGITRHLPLALTDLFNKLPDLTNKTVLSSLRTKSPSPFPSHAVEGLDKHPKVGIFVGCLINYAYPEIYEATTKLLDKYGVSYVTPKDQLCCGTPLLLYGDKNNAKRIARHNMKVFRREKVDAIITMCASCGRMLSQEYSKWGMGNCECGIKVIDIVEFLNKFAIPNSPSAIRTTYHTPCHFTWTKAGGISRKILKETSDYKETDEEGLCCGGGGVFTFKYPKLSRQIGRHKIDLFKGNNIQTVVTGCPGCMMQLRYLLNDSGKTDIKVKHMAEVLNENTRLSGKESES